MNGPSTHGFPVGREVVQVMTPVRGAVDAR
jgi:hypothetical protein